MDNPTKFMNEPLVRAYIERMIKEQLGPLQRRIEEQNVKIGRLERELDALKS